MITAPVEKNLSVSELVVDTEVQRTEFDNNKVVAIVAKFNPSALGIVSVSERPDGTLVIIDGWHRWEAVRRVTDNTGELRCDVYSNLSLAEEAQLFLDLNNSKPVKLLDKFRVSRAGGDKFATEIYDICREEGYVIDGVVGDHHINAVQSLIVIHSMSIAAEQDPPTLRLTLRAIKRAWGHDRYGVQAPILTGLGRLFLEMGSQIDFDRVVNVLSKERGGAVGFLTRARQAAQVHHSRVAYAFAELVVDEYNVGLRTTKLPNWRIKR